MKNKDDLSPHRQLSVSLVQALHNYMHDLNGESCTCLYQTTQEVVEKQLCIFSLEKCNGNISAAAKLLGISRTTLMRKMEAHNLREK